MLESHPHIESPESFTSIWRYMTIDKFLHLLTSSSLWFSRCDYFEDGWEGRYSKATFQTFLKSFKGPEEKIHDLWTSYQNRINELRNCLYISCWHISEEESAALWQIHSAYGKSVAIKSTLHRLRDAVADVDPPIYYGRVKYLDYDTETMPMQNLFTPFMRKRRCFVFENELRMLHWNPELMDLGNDSSETEFPSGSSISVKLEPLIETLYVSPHADSYMRDTIALLIDRFGLSKLEVVQSNLFAAPM
ncbi:hypothetical protein [Aureliella helgolandensis]|uniref:DUF2971 domain-containing protein n=1 Tax=Aureliella helgolandensis TaxID=2527968 RepID=A0A518G718_9BACT|nr:hypothetical protein [Aureliella helgolandensis]QDV24376.1 hypothetical protein Q31a_26930 [Aureliella helgolandensis]